MIWPTLKKYGKYVGLALLGVGSIALYVVYQSWRKSSSSDAGMTEGTETLIKVVSGIKDNFKEANDTAKMEIVAARSEETATKAQLKQVMKVKNKVDRRKQLAAMLADDDEADA